MSSCDFNRYAGRSLGPFTLRIAVQWNVWTYLDRNSTHTFQWMEFTLLKLHILTTRMFHSDRTPNITAVATDWQIPCLLLLL